jgi:hypothetical protein
MDWQARGWFVGRAESLRWQYLLVWGVDRCRIVAQGIWRCAVESRNGVIDQGAGSTGLLR